MDEWRELRTDSPAYRRDYSARRVSSLARELWDPGEDERWPWGAWIVQHGPPDEAADEASTPVSRTRFVNEDGPREMSPWSFLRFWTMQIEQRWRVLP